MLLIVIKSFIITGMCYLALLMLKNNSAIIKQKIVLMSLSFCLLFPILIKLPLSININDYFNKTADIQNNLIPINPKIHNMTGHEPIIYLKEGTINNDKQGRILNHVSQKESSLYIVLILLWLTGFVYKFLKFSIQISQIKNIILNAKQLKLPYLRNTYKSKKINYYITNETKVPFLFVNYSTIEIILPQQAKTWDKTNITNVVRHELCHYKRKDHLAIWLAEFTSMVYWFHPLINLLVKKQKDLIEFACDEQLLNQGMDSQSYAKTILTIPSINNTVPLVANMSSKPSLLKTRIAAILKRQSKKLSKAKVVYLLFLSTTTLLVSCVNNVSLLSINNLMTLVSYDLPSFRTGSIESDEIHIATMYDGIQNDLTFVEFEISQKNSNQTKWLKLGPLKKFTDQYQTWHYKLINDSTLTGNYRISGVQADGVVDGVAIGLYYTGNKGYLKIHKSVGPIVNETPNIVCSWPLNLRDVDIKRATPQLTNHNAESIKRLLCGSQLLNNGIYSF